MPMVAQKRHLWSGLQSVSSRCMRRVPMLVIPSACDQLLSIGLPKCRCTVHAQGTYAGDCFGV